jgi:endonuclease III-like uncharacterized protein
MLDNLERERARSAQPEPARDLYARYHALIVMHCKHLCLKRSPRCNECRLRERCQFPASLDAAAQARG